MILRARPFFFARTPVAALVVATLTAALLWLALATPSARAQSFEVSSAADSGPGTLRQAILDANASPGLDTITFNLSGTLTIQPLSALPWITDSLVLDGTTQPGYAGTPLITLSGQSAGAGVDGLKITAGGSTVRGLAIGRFRGDGIELTNGGGNLIEANYIGTDHTGTLDRGNGLNGISVTNSALNTIGGTSPGSGNLLSGNDKAGLVLYGTLSVSNTVQGNLVGTNASGMAALPNFEYGIDLLYAPGNLIGGTQPDARNLVSGNTYAGICLFGSPTRDNRIQGNWLGVASDGSTPLGNQRAGFSIVLAQSNLIGGTQPGEGNIIAYSGTDGVMIRPNDGSPNEGTRNAILGNRIYGNAQQGIDLNDDGPTVNDPGDGDSGPNRRQNTPLISYASIAGGTLSIAGTLNSAPQQSFRVELYANSQADPSGYGQGELYLGAVTITTDSAGNGAFSLALPRPGVAISTLSATASDASGNTSEFSRAFVAPQVLVYLPRV